MKTDVPQMHMCPLCAAPCEVEGGYDDVYYIFSCDHGDLDPWPIEFRQYLDPATREAFRAIACEGLWVQYQYECDARREATDEGLPGSHYLSHALDLLYVPEHRRARYDWRRLSATDAFSQVMRHLYAGPIQEALNQGSVFLAAVTAESRDALIDTQRAISRTAFADDA